MKTLFFALLILTAPLFAHDLLINEFLASSHSTMPDPDFSQISDWIEIYNAGDSEVDLSDYYITDDFAQPTKWSLPSAILEPNDYFLIWADGQDDVDEAAHSNFKLNNKGEVIGIFSADGSVIDSVSFGTQVRDVSFGRSLNNTNQFVYFEEPTPGQKNTSGLPTSQQSAAVTINLKSGFYSGSQTVVLSAPGTIRYTTDGSTPTRLSDEYSSPLTISETSVLKARSFESALLPGPIARRTFFINEQTTLPVFSLTTDPDFLWDDDIGIYVDEDISKRKEWERPAHIEFFETAGQSAFEQETSIRLFGRTAIYIPQKSLSIFLSDNLNYPLFENGAVDTFDSFLLRSSSDDWHLTMFRDAFIQKVVAKNMALDIQDYRPAVLFINGDYWGIHNIRDKYNESYIASHHNIAADSIDMLYIDERQEDVTVLAGDRVHYEAMIDFATNNDLSEQTNYKTLAGMIDIDNMIDYVIAQAYIGNRSWAHNIRAWRPRTSDGKWQWLIFDLDRGFRYVDYNSLEEMANRFHPFDELLDNDDFRNMFVERFLHYCNEAFQPDNLISVLDSLQLNIANEMPNHINRWQGYCGNGVCGINSLEDWQDNVDDMRDIIQQRPDVVHDQLIDVFNLNSEIDLAIRVREPGYGLVHLGETTISDSFSGHFVKDMNIQLEAAPNDGFQFHGWKKSSASSTTLLSRGSEWHYFDLGYLPADNWASPNFDDSAWESGPAELGYGDGNENTVVDYGPDSGNKYITTYFRTTFSVDDTAGIENLLLSLKRDDGAVVYLNGTEILRSNMPEGEINFDTRAANSGSSSEDSFLDFTLATTPLQIGENSLAVEVHQYSASSSDISFDLELEAISSYDSESFISSDPVLNMTLSEHMAIAAIFSSSSQNELPSQISQNLTLTAANSPYLVMHDVIVQPNVTLICDKGAEIHCAPNASLIINGQFIANGTADSPVILKGFGNGRWGALCFETSTGASTLSHVLLNGATNGPDAAHYKAAVSAWSSDVTLDGVTIKNVNQPLYGNGGAICLTNSILDGTGSGDDIANIQYASARIEGNHLFGNGELDFDAVHNGIIRNNRIDIISTNSNRDGIDIGTSNDVLIENNQIYNCPDKGISVGEASENTIIRRNLVVNASMGVAVKDASSTLVDHNTFYNADIGIACYEKNAGRSGGHAVVSNSIFAGTFTDEFSIDASSSIELSYCFSENKLVDGKGNLAGMVHFVNPTKDNFHLQHTSPCIDAGDPVFEQEADGTRSDIGAFFFNQGPINTDGLVINEFMANNSKTLADENGEFDDWIELYNGSDSAINLAGLYLTDDLNAPTLWRIADYAPDSTTIAPNGFLILWADKDSLQGVRHARFKLNADTEQIILIKATKDRNQISVIDSVSYTHQQADISYGRGYDGASDWRPFNTPTPGEENDPLWTRVSQSILPTRFLVHPNYPNPFNPITTIIYELPNESLVTFEIFNALGQRVTVLLNESKEAGVHRIEWRGVNSNGEAVSSGLYFYKVKAGEFSATGKMMLLQ